MQPVRPTPAPPTPTLTAGEALRLGVERLRRAGVEGARLDMSLILAEALGTDRLGLYMDLDRPLDEAERGQARALLARRVAREPMAYILGRREFFGLELAVTRDTLIPRPETEHLVEAVLAWLTVREESLPAPCIADVGTGSGAIAIAVAQACPRARAIASDVSAPALEVARANAARHGVEGRVEFRLGSLLDPLGAEGAEGDAAQVDAILSNPPYVPTGDAAGMEPDVVAFEPHGALFSGADGLDCIRALIQAAPGRLRPGGLLALECGQGQAEAIRALIDATGAFAPAQAIADLAGIERIVTAERTN